MGATSKPLYIQVSPDVYKAGEQMWVELMKQGHRVEVLVYEEFIPDIILASNAMRMTADMLMAMPSVLTLAIKGARALRYAPHGTTPTKGKTKGAKDKKPRARKDSTKQVEARAGGTTGDAQVHQASTRENQGIGESINLTTSAPTDDERII